MARIDADDLALEAFRQAVGLAATVGRHGDSRTSPPFRIVLRRGLR